MFEINKIHEKNILVNSPGISITFDQSRLSDIRKKLKIDPKSTVVLFAGTKSYDKGAIFLLNSLEILWQNNFSIDLILIGPKSGEFSSHLQQKSETIRRHVHDLGIVNNDEKLSIFPKYLEPVTGPNIVLGGKKRKINIFQNGK